MDEGLIYTNSNCVGCNRCVRICSSFGASVSIAGPERSSIRINAERCIVCGACIDVCAHKAREYVDDTEAFFEALAAGEQISVLVAPSFEAKYPAEYRKVFGALRELGVNRIIPVSFGADICTWAYLKCIEEEGLRGMISTSCPVVVSYIEHWLPDLIPQLMPIKSPLLCAATYCREELGITDKLAFVGPCIAKRLEADRYPDLLSYNVTFPKLFDHIRSLGPADESGFDDIEYGLGSYYPAPGGLADNVRWFLGDDTPVRIVSGKQYLYERFEKNKRKIFSFGKSYALIDALNCQEGCVEGTAKATEDREDGGLAMIHQIRSESKSPREGSPWNPNLTPAERLECFNQQFSSLNFDSYRATFVDQSSTCDVQIPIQDEAEAIFESLHKTEAAARQINCSACGYESCWEMAVAIHNGFNSHYNCVYFEKEEAIYLTRMSYGDELTGVMNRNALERTKGELFGEGHSLCLIVADVNGLKQVNDTNGHAAGDRLIIATAEALANQFGRARVFRTGGDEFLVVLQDFTIPEAEQGMTLVREHLRDRDVSTSMGMAHSDAHHLGFDALQLLADARMYEDKAYYYEHSGARRRQ